MKLLAAFLAAFTAADSTRFYSGVDGRLEVEPPRVEARSLRVDGSLDEPVRAEAALLRGFTQYDPVEGAGAYEPTEVLVFYGPDTLYFGVRASTGTRPGSGRATATGTREPSWTTGSGSSWTPSTTSARRTPSTSTPSASRATASRSRDSDGRITGDGWVAEIRIPYGSLRFRTAPLRAWGFNVGRHVKRLAYKSSWAPVTQQISSELAQAGPPTGLRGLEPGRLLEVNPVVTGRRTGEVVDGEFVRGSFEPEVGVNGRVGLPRSLVLIDGIRQEGLDDGTFQAQVLVSYEPSPGRIFVGFSRVAEGRCEYDVSGMDTLGEGLFVKLSYLLRS